MDAEVSEALRHARLLRPFPVKRLHDRVLFQLLTATHALQNDVTALLIDPPTTPAPWCVSLWKIGAQLESIADLCDAALPHVGEMIEASEGEYTRAIDAMTRILQGIAAASPQEVAPS